MKTQEKGILSVWLDLPEKRRMRLTEMLARLALGEGMKGSLERKKLQDWNSNNPQRERPANQARLYTEIVDSGVVDGP